jgi:hydroxypyruvate isomerase
MRRREAIGALAAAGFVAKHTFAADSSARLKQGVTAGVFDPKLSFEEKCKLAAELGCKGFDLVKPEDWPVLKKYGLTPSMSPQNAGVTIADALNNKENHDRIEKTFRSISARRAGARTSSPSPVIDAACRMSRVRITAWRF